MICGSRGSKSRLAKAAGAEPAGQMRDEKLHAVVARSTFQVKMYKPTHQLRTTFGSWDVEKVHALVVRSTCRSQVQTNTLALDHFWKLRCRKSVRPCGAKKKRSQNVQNTPCSDHFWKLRCPKSARRCGAKHMSKSKGTKHSSSGPLLEVAMSKKCTAVARSTFRSQNVKNTTSDHFLTFRCRFAWQAQGIAHLVKSVQTWGFCSISMHFQKRWQALDIWRGSAKMHFPWQAQYKRHVHQRCSEVRALISWEGLHFGASGLQFCEDDFAWQVQHFVWPGITFSRQAQYFRQVEWKNRKTHWYEAINSALNFPFLKKSRRILSFLMLSTSKNEEVSQTCFVFDVVKNKNWGSLAELLRFWCCQVQKLRKSRRIASFLTLSSSRVEEVSQNCFVFGVVKFKNWVSLTE